MFFQVIGAGPTETGGDWVLGEEGVTPVCQGVLRGQRSTKF